MEVLKIREVQEFLYMCEDVYQQGWHEINGGNASHRLTAETVEHIKSKYKMIRHYELDITVDNLKGEYFIITGSGQQMRNIFRYPKEVVGIIQIGEDGASYDLVWGLERGSNPTTELAIHLFIHNVSKASNNRSLLHSHPPVVNRLIFNLEQDSIEYTKALESMMAECSIGFPEGVEIIDWTVCGSDQLTRVCAEKLDHCNVVIWSHHGISVIAETPDLAFALLHTIEKAATQYLEVLKVGGRNSGIGLEDVKLLNKEFNFEFKEAVYE